MGFNPWNVWGKMNGGGPKLPGGIAGYNQSMLEATAEAMVSRGLRDAGYVSAPCSPDAFLLIFAEPGLSQLGLRVDKRSQRRKRPSSEQNGVSEFHRFDREGAYIGHEIW